MRRTTEQELEQAKDDRDVARARFQEMDRKGMRGSGDWCDAEEELNWCQGRVAFLEGTEPASRVRF